jgi:hypothetical protein
MRMQDVKFSFDTILSEHRRIRLLVEDLGAFLKEPRPEPGSREARRWASSLTERLLELHETLCAHFDEEEESGALDELSSRHPRATAVIRRLQAEHETILRGLRAVICAAMVYAEGRDPENPHLRRSTSGVLEQLVRHERQESDLIARTLAPTDLEAALDEELDGYLRPACRCEFAAEALCVPLRAVGWQAVPALPAGSTVAQALRLLQQGGTSCVVVTSGGTPAGLVTERDLLTRAISKVANLEQARVEDVMTREMFALQPDEPLAHALMLMDEGGFRHVLVLENGMLHGVVTARGILHYLTRLLPEEVRVLGSVQVPQQRDGG